MCSNTLRWKTLNLRIRADIFSVSQEIPFLLRILKFHYLVLKARVRVPILSQIVPVHVPVVISLKSDPIYA